MELQNDDSNIINIHKEQIETSQSNVFLILREMFIDQTKSFVIMNNECVNIDLFASLRHKRVSDVEIKSEDQDLGDPWDLTDIQLESEFECDGLDCVKSIQFDLSYCDNYNNNGFVTSDRVCQDFLREMTFDNIKNVVVFAGSDYHVDFYGQNDSISLATVIILLFVAFISCCLCTVWFYWPKKKHE